MRCGLELLRLQVGVFAGNVQDAWTILIGVEVVMSHDQGAGVRPA